MADRRWTTLSAAHARTDLPESPKGKGFPPRLARVFEPESDALRAAQRRDMAKTEAERRQNVSVSHGKPQSPKPHRGSTMVKAEKPQPVPRPSPDLAHGADKAAFNARWRSEQRQALKAEIRERKSELHQLGRTWDSTITRIDATEGKARAGDPEGAKRDAFKAYRRAELQSGPVFGRSHGTIGKAEAWIAQDPDIPRTRTTPPIKPIQTKGDR